MKTYIAEIVVSKDGPGIGRLFHTVEATTTELAVLIAAAYCAAMRANSQLKFSIVEVVPV